MSTDWNALQGAIAGDVLLPGSPDFELVRMPAMARFSDVAPAAIVRCRAPEHVAEALAFARRSGAEVAVRGGGHCFAGSSSTRGILIDVGPMSSVAVVDGTVTIGGGARLGGVYDALEEHGRTIAAGCGPSVGIAGLTIGGGIGILGRLHGLTSDQLLAADVVLADGRAVRCDEHDHADLFWALRGAGGLRFGVVTSLLFRTLPAPDATSFDLRWPPRAASAIVDAWQDWAPDAPEEVAASLLVTAAAEPDRPVVVRVFGAVLSSEPDARRTLDGLVARTGVDPGSATLEHLSYRQTKRHLAEPDAEPAAKPEPGHVFTKSEFFRAPLPAETIAALVEHIGDGRSPGQARELDFTPWGGAYNRVGPAATTFFHRAERFLLKHEVVVEEDGAQATTPAAREWLARSWALAHPSGTGGAYPNFPDPDLGTWDRAYHGANLDRLLRVKARYDPDDIFHGYDALML
ncbi:MAG: FAD-binding oxidoreductase [Solirubrobacteraceae bacterium]